MINNEKVEMATKIYLKSYAQVLKEFHDPTFATQVATVVTMVLVKEESIQPVQNPLFALVDDAASECSVRKEAGQEGYQETGQAA